MISPVQRRKLATNIDGETSWKADPSLTVKNVMPKRWLSDKL